MYTFTGAIWTKVKEGLVQIFQRWNQIGSIQKQPSVGIWKKKNILETIRKKVYERKIREENQNYQFDKREISYDKPSSWEKRKLCVKRVMIKALIPQPIGKEAAVRVLRKVGMNKLVFGGKESWPKMTWNWGLRFS